MEEITQRMKLGKVSFRRQPSKHSTMNERLEKINEVNVMELSKERSGQSESQCPLEYPKSPYHAMEFLSRTWGPSSDDFFQLFSLNNLVPRLENKDDIKEEHEEQGTTESEVQIQCIQAEELNMQHIKTWPVHQREHQIGKMKLAQPKSWLSTELLRNILKVNPKRRKDELRLHASQVNAALSVANLAAAISGILANCTLEPNKHSKNMMNMINGGMHEECDQMKMNSVLASAAALIATVCAEGAESVGAQRAHISSAINSGLRTRTSADMLDLTASAATSLRGAATLERRAASSKLYLSDDQKMLSNGSKLLIRTPAGRVELRRVRIYLKHSKLILILGKKHMIGFITTYREYRIIGVVEDREGGGEFTKDESGMYFVAIATSEGTIKLFFQDEKQFKTWKSSISHLLFNSHGSC